jgi:hypothetical protein
MDLSQGRIRSQILSGTDSFFQCQAPRKVLDGSVMSLSI